MWANLGNWFKALLVKMFMSKVILTGSPSEIIMKLRTFRQQKSIYLLESFFEKNPYKKAHSYEVFYYVEANKLMQWCGVTDYKHKRTPINVLRTQYQRATN